MGAGQYTGMTAPAPRVDRLGTAWRYLALGFTHIVPHGLDHILFVLGITGVVKVLLWIAIIAFVLWLIGLFMSRRRGV